LVEVEFSEGLEVIGMEAFCNCTNLKYVNKLPSTLNEIGDEAFYNCYILDSIEFPEGLQVIGGSAFEGCESSMRIKIASALVGTKREAFAYCRSLTSVDLPEGLQVIGEAWFLDCYALTHLRIPSSVVRIEKAAIKECTRLVSLELPEGLEKMYLDESYDLGEPSIYGCESLVNLVIPSKQQVEQLEDDAEFMENLKLRHVASSFDDLVSKLQNQFDTLAVHRLCYYQSYYPLTEALENLRQSMDADPSAGTKVDSFGMTPFHILALSQTPNLSLFQALLEVYKVDIIQTRDKFGSTPRDYLCLNHTPDSAKVIQLLIRTIIVQRMQWLGLARWKTDVLAALDSAFAIDWSSREREIRLLYFKLETYERLEAISLLELALWKVKIDGCKDASETDHEREEESSPKRPRLDKSQLDGVDRQSCQINSDADVVISNVLPFLDKVCREDYCVAD
jgi:hypothetical protein